MMTAAKDGSLLVKKQYDLQSVLGKNFGEVLGKLRTRPKKREPIDSRFYLIHQRDYMFAMIASPNSEHFSSLAPSIRRSKS